MESSPSERIDVRSGLRLRDGLCDRHGKFESYFGRCPTCEKEDSERRHRAEEEAKLRDKQAAWLRHSGLRGRFLEATFGTFEASTPKQKVTLKSCQNYIESLDFSVWRPLWLIGAPGTGKTHLGAAMVQACIAVRHRAAAVATPREIVRELRATWRRDSAQSEEDIVDSYAAYPLLVLDEVGVGFGSDGEITQLFEVIDRRYQLSRPTVIVSNLAAPELRSTLGDRIFDRLRENAQVLPCDWPSHRGPSAAPRGPL